MIVVLALALAAGGALISQPSIYVIGDSTAKNGDGRGWGDPFAQYFDASRVNVTTARGLVDRAAPLSRKAFRKASGKFCGRATSFSFNLATTMAAPPTLDALAGIGDESREVTLPDGKKETVHTFGYYVRRYIAEARAAGATPIVLSTTVRNMWAGGKVARWSEVRGDMVSGRSRPRRLKARLLWM